MMRAAVYHGAGDVRVESVAAPGDPGPGELLLAPRMGAICGTDASEFAHGPHMIPLHQRHPGSGCVGPLVIGHEFVGRVEAVGEGVEGVAVGDRVVSGAGVSCGECAWCLAGRTNLCASYYTLGLSAPGGLAELVRSPASICHTVPAAVADEAAAMAQPLAVAIHALDRGGVGKSPFQDAPRTSGGGGHTARGGVLGRPNSRGYSASLRPGPAWSGARQPHTWHPERGSGQTLAVLGIGGIGAFIVGAAATRGLERLIAVDVDPAKLALAGALGADEVIDARSEDVAAAIREATGGDGADVVMEATGVPASPSIAIHAARRGGRVVIVGLQAEPPPVDVFDAALREVDLTTTVAHICDTNLPESLGVLAETEVAGQVLDRVISLERIVEDGLAPLAEGRAGGKIVVEVTS